MCTEKLSLSLRQVILFPFGRNIAPRSFFPADPRHTDEETSSSSWKFNFWQVSGGLSLPPPLPVLIWPPKPPSWRQNLLGKSLGKKHYRLRLAWARRGGTPSLSSHWPNQPEGRAGLRWWQWWPIPNLIQFNVWILPTNDSFNIRFNIALPKIQFKR